LGGTHYALAEKFFGMEHPYERRADGTLVPLQKKKQQRQVELLDQSGIQPIWFAPGDFAQIGNVLQFLATLKKG
jgi:hypothetical protein